MRHWIKPLCEFMSHNSGFYSQTYNFNPHSSDFLLGVWPAATSARTVESSCFQVQLLISTLDVENYKLIKADLDRLRTLVEKSELWVEKKSSGGGDGKKDKKEKGEVRNDTFTFYTHLRGTFSSFKLKSGLC